MGERWFTTAESRVVGPSGETEVKHSAASENGESRSYVEPALAGAYQITDGQGTMLRYAMRHPQEHIRQSPEDVAGRGVTPQGFQLSRVGISREVALLVLILSFFELCVRVLRRPKSDAILEQTAAYGPPSPSQRPGRGDLQKTAS